MTEPLTVGDVIHEFARGAFGRDHYDCTKIEAAGPDWIVARDADGDLSFASGRETLERLIMARDEDKCPDGDDCTLGETYPPLTVPGGY